MDKDDIVFNYCNVPTKTITHDDETKNVLYGMIGIKILHMNIRSVRKNIDQFCIFLQNIDSEVDIIILTEALLHDDLPTYNIPSYLSVSAKGKLTRNEGVIIYYKEHLKINIPNIEIAQCTSLLIEIETPKNEKFSILGIYRTPSIQDTIPFEESLHKLLTKTKNQMKPIIVGDINIDISDKLSFKCENYLNMLSEHGYISCINDYTRVQNNSKSCIDHIFIPEIFYSKQIQSYIIETNITDHFSQIINLPFFSTKSKNCPEQKTIIKKINYETLKEALSKETWIEVLDTQDTHEAYAQFLVKFKTHINNSTKTSTIKKNAHKTKIKPWITDNLLQQMRFRDKLIKAKKHNTDPNFIKYVNSYANAVKTGIQITKNNYYSKELLAAKNDMRQIWKLINTITNSTKDNKTKIDTININNKEIRVSENVKLIADTFNEHYAKIGQTLTDKIQQKSNYELENIEICDHTIFLHAVIEKDIKHIINHLTKTNSTGSDEINTSTLKETSDFIAKPLTHIFNRMIETGDYPEPLKEAHVIPIFKDGNKKEIINYRPISLINNISKIFEKALLDQLNKFAEKYKIFAENQYGFQKDKNCEDSIYDLAGNINDAKNSQDYCLVIFLDLSKAFDTLIHSILIEKLEKLGIRGKAKILIENYLKNRTQKTIINGTTSKLLILNQGTPQGTRLSPFLFKVHLNDLLKLVLHGKISAFADDTILFVRAKDRKTLYQFANEDLIKIRNWLNKNMLVINLEKTRYIEFKTGNKKDISEPNTYEICDIQKTDKIKHLGLIWDEKLKWEEHISYITIKLRKTIYKFLLLRNCMDEKTLKMTYLALAQSHITYGLTAFGGAYNNIAEKLYNVQKKILKIIYRKPALFPTIDLFTISNTLTVHQLYVTQSIIEINKRRMTMERVRHEHNTRHIQRQPLRQPVTKLTYIQRQTQQIGIFYYNRLPQEIKSKMTRQKLTQWTKTNVPMTF